MWYEIVGGILLLFIIWTVWSRKVMNKHIKGCLDDVNDIEPIISGSPMRELQGYLARNNIPFRMVKDFAFIEYGEKNVIAMQIDDYRMGKCFYGTKLPEEYKKEV